MIFAMVQFTAEGAEGYGEMDEIGKCKMKNVDW